MLTLSQEDQGDVGKDEEPHHYAVESGEVLLHDPRTGDGTPDATPERGGEAPALAGVQEYERDERDAEQRVEES